MIPAHEPQSGVDIRYLHAKTDESIVVEIPKTNGLHTSQPPARLTLDHPLVD
jgi:hypothetical protein